MPRAEELVAALDHVLGAFDDAFVLNCLLLVNAQHKNGTFKIWRSSGDWTRSMLAARNGILRKLSQSRRPGTICNSP